MFGALLYYEWGGAFRTWLVDGLVRCGEIAIWVTAAAVENAAGTTSAGNTAANEFTFVAFRAFDAQRDWARVFALRIIRAADEVAEAALAAE